MQALQRAAVEAKADPLPQEESCTTLYVGNLHPIVNQAALTEVCTYFGEVQQVKIIKDKATGGSAGYGFVRFAEQRCAEQALSYLSQKVFYGQELRVNWAFQSHTREDTTTHFHIFVGDLSQDITDAVLFQAFLLPGGGGCSDARVMWDHATGRSKGYGFVSFRSKEEADKAIERMHGQVIGARRVRCGWAQHKQDDSGAPLDFDSVDKADQMNSNIYVGNIAPAWSEQEIQLHFASFGRITEIKLHKKGGYGFIKFERHEDAVRAIVESHGREMMGRPLKCSWGKAAVTSSGGGGRFTGANHNTMQHLPLMLPNMQNMLGGSSNMLAHQQMLMPSMQSSMQNVLGSAPGMLQTQLVGSQLAAQSYMPHQGQVAYLTPSQMMLMAAQQGTPGAGAPLQLQQQQQQQQQGPRSSLPPLDAQSMFYAPALYYS